MIRFPLRCALLVAAGLATPAMAQTITVTTGDDDVDFGGQQRVADLPGPDGLISIREAVIAANNTDGPQTITFAIPRSRWWPVLPNHATCLIQNGLFLTSPDTTIDCTTQTQLTGDTNPTGWEVAFYYNGPPSSVSHFMVLTDRTTIKGLDYVGGNAFGAGVRFYGSDNRLISCTDGSVSIERLAPDAPQSTRNIIGGLLPGEGNRLLSVDISFGCDGNTIIGNVIRRVAIRGDSLYGSCDNNRVGGPTPAERNVLSGNATHGEEGLPTGFQLDIAGADGTIVEGNYVGTTEDGMAVWPTLNGTSGISLGRGAINTTIRNNLISGIARTGSNHYQGQRFGIALVIGDGTANTLVVGNRIGSNADGSAPITNVAGIGVYRPTVQAQPLTDLVIGTTTPGQGNIITGSETTGLLISSTAAGVRISGNSIYANGGLGIDLLGAAGGVTPNDPADADTGGNNLQNFPVISSATAGPGTLRIAGTLQSLPDLSYAIEFFSSDACDPSGFGEGQTFIGSASVTTDASGNSAFDVSFDTSVPAGAFVTATATRDSTADTSEFSACAPVTEPSCPADFNHDHAITSQDFFDFLTAFFTDKADFNADGSTNSQDFFDFLAAFFVGC